MPLQFYMRGFNTTAPGTVGYVDWVVRENPDTNATFVPSPYTPAHIANIIINKIVAVRANETTVSTATYAVDSGSKPDDVLLCNRSGTITITLPSPTAGRFITIKDVSGAASTNNITVSQHASETIDGSATFVITNNFESIILISDGTNWFVS